MEPFAATSPAPTVSVIVPTFGHRDFVLETLRSVFDQTYDAIEVIVVNDGSPDDTAERLRPFVDAGRIHYVEQPNAGQGAARNRGAAVARGKFLAFLDDDDLWPADKLAWQVAAMTDPTVVAVGGLVSFINGDWTEPWPHPADQTLVTAASIYRNGNPFRSPGQVLVRRAAFEAVGGFDPAIWGVDDLDLWIRLAAAGRFARYNHVALVYRVHASNASNAAARMVSNGRTTIEKNLPLLPADLRADARRDAYRWMYEYGGSTVVRKARSPSVHAVRDAASVLCGVIGPASRDSLLARRVGRDLCPDAIVNLSRAVSARVRSRTTPPAEREGLTTHP